MKEKGLVYRCPFCNGNVRSDVRTGRINHQPACGNLFYVTDGAVSKKTRCHAHSCPVCSTVVWSSQSCGRIAVTHDTPSGKTMPEETLARSRQKGAALAVGERQAWTHNKRRLVARVAANTTRDGCGQSAWSKLPRGILRV